MLDFAELEGVVVVEVFAAVCRGGYGSPNSLPGAAERRAYQVAIAVDNWQLREAGLLELLQHLLRGVARLHRLHLAAGRHSST